MFELNKVSKIYSLRSGKKNNALVDISFKTVDKGIVFIVGKSGSGKSTLLQLIGGLDSLTSGSINYVGNLENKLNTSFVFQDFNLIDDFTIKENLSMFSSDSNIEDILKVVGLDYININRKVKTLSGGERQRIAIARGLIKSCNVMLLDEPTGNLDTDNADKIFNLLNTISKDKLLIVVTHDMKYANMYGDQIITIEKGKIISNVIADKTRLLVKDCEINNDVYEVFRFLTQSNNKCVEFDLRVNNENVGKFKVEYHNLTKELIDIFNKNLNNDIEFVKYSDNIVKYEIKSNDVSFGLEHQSKYSKILLQANYKKIILHMVMFVISMTLLFIELAFLSVSEGGMLNNAIDEEGYNYASITRTECNVYMNTCLEYSKGNRLYEDLVADYGTDNVFYYVDNAGVSSTNTEYYANISIVDGSDIYSNMDIVGNYPQNDNEVLISDFLAQVLYYDTSDDTLGKELRFQNGSTFVISGIYKTDYIEKNVIDNLRDDKFVERNNDHFFMYYDNLYMTFDGYSNNYLDDILYIPGGNFSYIDETTSVYVKIASIYENYDNSVAILDGRVPSSQNEILISTKYLRDSFNLNIGDDLTDIYSEVYMYKDLEESINYISYQEYVNMYRVFPEGVKIVGVYDSTYSDIMFSFEDNTDFLKEYAFSSVSGYKVTINDTDEFVSKTLENDYTIANRYGNISKNFDEFLNGSFLRIFKVLLISLMSLSVILLYTNFSNIIKSRQKDFGILKSLGVPTKSISNIFIIYNLVQYLIMSFLVIILGFISIAFVNDVFSSEDVLNISFDIMNPQFMTFIIIILISFATLAVSVLIPMLRIKKLSIIEVIKDIE